MKKIAVVFPGQGSQYVGMAREFLAQHASARTLMEQAEDLCGLPLRRLCLEGPLEDLTRSVTLQPAVTTVNLICWQAIREGLPQFVPACFAGHSLGEFSALAAAGVLTTESCLRLVVRRGELMEREADLHPGSMRAALGLEVERVRDILAAGEGVGVAVVANHNTAQQIVLSGDEAGLDRACAHLREAGARIIPLKVALANHSPLVAGAVPDFAAALEREQFLPPAAPVYCNVSAASETDPALIRDLLARQLASPVRWYEIARNMLAAGVEVFVEVGPKNVLTGILRKIVPADSPVCCLQVEDAAGLAVLAEMVPGAAGDA